MAYHFIHWDASDSAPILPNATGEDADVDEREAGTHIARVRPQGARADCCRQDSFQA